jgi:hypothetical protein
MPFIVIPVSNEDHVVMIALMLMFPKLASTSMTQKYYFGLF